MNAEIKAAGRDLTDGSDGGNAKSAGGDNSVAAEGNVEQVEAAEGAVVATGGSRVKLRLTQGRGTKAVDGVSGLAIVADVVSLAVGAIEQPVAVAVAGGIALLWVLIRVRPGSR